PPRNPPHPEVAAVDLHPQAERPRQAPPRRQAAAEPTSAEALTPTARRGQPSSMTARTLPSSTASPSLILISFTVPAHGASTGISIFIDSRMMTVSPSLTLL